MKPVALVGWSGSGDLEDLERTASGRLEAHPASLSRLGQALVVDAKDPVDAARRLAFLPGVEWVAVGYRFSGNGEYLKTLTQLARRYVSRGTGFRVSAQSSGSKTSAGDMVLSGNSEVLGQIPGARIDERRPRVRFRVCIEGSRGACGVEVVQGPRGTPTGSEWVSCLVSGGERSSAMAWMAALSGCSVRLVHSAFDDASLRHVARVYSELSRRMDPRCVEVQVLDGEGSPMGRLGAWLQMQGEVALAGLRPAPVSALVGLASAFPNLAFPLLLVEESSLGSTFRSLEVGRPARGEAPGLTLESLRSGGVFSVRRFGGVEADSNEVIDSLLRESPSSARVHPASRPSRRTRAPRS